MSNTTGRYFIIDEKSGRKFCIEPLHTRSEKSTDVTFKNGGISGDGIKGPAIQGGSILEEESIITEENGYKDSIKIGPYMSPDALIQDVCSKGLKLNDPNIKHTMIWRPTKD